MATEKEIRMRYALMRPHLMSGRCGCGRAPKHRHMVMAVVNWSLAQPVSGGALCSTEEGGAVQGAQEVADDELDEGDNDASSAPDAKTAAMS